MKESFVLPSATVSLQPFVLDSLDYMETDAASCSDVKKFKDKQLREREETPELIQELRYFVLM